MKRTRKQQQWFVGAALAALAAAPVIAQVRSSQDGRAMDANTRVGSGGYNSGAGTGQIPTATPNQIIYGDVTGGKQFRGPIIERDPGAFTGPTGAGLIDRFNAGSSGTPLPYQPSFTLSTPQPFFGDSRSVAPPPGSVRIGFTGSYLGTSLMPTAEQTGWSSEYFNNIGAWQTTQSLSVATVVGTRDTVLSSRPGETLILQGPRGSENQSGALSGSPLYGVQPIVPGEATQGDIGPATPGAASPFSQLGADRFQFDAAELRRLRSELQPNNEQPNEKQQPGAKQNENGGPKTGQPLEAPENQPLGSQTTPAFQSNAIEASGVNTGQGIQRRLTVNLPRQQSEQYNELRRRLARYENPQVAAIQANIDFQRDLRQLRTAAAQGQGPTSRPAPRAIASAPPQSPGAAAPEPLRINSLAAGVRAKGLHDLLTAAEDLMRQGKFESAIEKYNMAEQVAPDEHLIPLGRANAELGAGYYRLAASDLHRVFLSDPALVLGQYDLTQWMPPQRLQYISKELQTLAAGEPQQETPVFLLAYVSYNAGHASEAARYLDQAQQRAGSSDPLLSMLRSHWKLHSGGSPAPGEQINK